MGKIKVFNKNGFQILILCSVGALGLYGQQNRFEQMADPFDRYAIPEDITFAISPYADAFKNVLNIPVESARSFDFKDSDGSKILYLSQTIDFGDWVAQSEFTAAQINSIVNVEIIKNIPGKNSFLPYFPEAISDNRFAYNRRNGLYVSTFQVSPLTE